MIFKNECNCIVDENLLAKAVDTYCRRKNIYCKGEYRITTRNGYPHITINREHLFVHDLLVMILYHPRPNYVVHHIDRNKLNDSVENLAYISHSKHSKLHSDLYWEKVRIEDIKVKRDVLRKDISNDEIRKMLNDGVSVKEIAKHFNCHHNTIYKRKRKWEREG